MSLAGQQQQVQTWCPQLTQCFSSHLSHNIDPLQQQATRASTGTAGSKPAQPLTQQDVHFRAPGMQSTCRLSDSPAAGTAGTWMEVMLRDRLQKMRRLTSRQEAATLSVQLGRSSLRGGGPGGKATPAYMRQGRCLVVVRNGMCMCFSICKVWTSPGPQSRAAGHTPTAPTDQFSHLVKVRRCQNIARSCLVGRGS